MSSSTHNRDDLVHVVGRLRRGEQGELSRELGDVAESVLPILLETLSNDGFDPGIDVGGDERRGGIVEDLRAELRERLGVEGQMPTQELEEHDTESPDIAPRVDVGARP